MIPEDFKLTADTIQAMKKQLMSADIRPADPDKFFLGYCLPDRGWFHLTKSGVTRVTLINDELLYEELTPESADMIRQEVLAHIEECGKKNSLVDLLKERHERRENDPS
jgi:hypothetical protein